MSSIVVRDASQWLTQGRVAQLLLTDPPHLDTFTSVSAHRAFAANWLRAAFTDTITDSIVHSCGEDPRELENYLRIHTPDQILVWRHATGHHYMLVHRRGLARGRLYPSIITDDKPYLWRLLIQLMTEQRDLVLDPFCGHGQIPEMARHSGRRWAGCDTDAAAVRYCAETLGL